MNSLESVRQRAERLHAEAVAAGHNPRIPYDFVRAEAAKRLIDVERLPKGDIRLHTGRALYDPDALFDPARGYGRRLPECFPYRSRAWPYRPRRAIGTDDSG